MTCKHFENMVLSLLIDTGAFVVGREVIVVHYIIYWSHLLSHSLPSHLRWDHPWLFQNKAVLALWCIYG